MNVLGIESSCDETAAAVVTDGRVVRSSIIWSQIDQHAPFGGVVPEIASRSHLNAIVPVVNDALGQAGMTLDDIDGLAVTIGPGLIGALLVGVQFAKGLALGLGLPIVGVNHIEAHFMAAFLTDSLPKFPFVALAVSGGHSSIFRVDDFGRFTLLGRTLDDAAGEAFDKAATMLGLPYPGGVAIDKVARNGNPASVAFPRSMIKEPGYNMSFSGLKSAMRRHVEGRVLSDQEINDAAAAFREAVVDVLVAKTMSAAVDCNVSDIVIAGGVAANSRLREVLGQRTAQKGLILHALPLELCSDNAAMIAGLGHQYLFGACSDFDCPRGLDMDPFTRLVATGG